MSIHCAMQYQTNFEMSKWIKNNSWFYFSLITSFFPLRLFDDVVDNSNSNTKSNNNVAADQSWQAKDEVRNKIKQNVF